jgi:hypothetical protein
MSDEDKAKAEKEFLEQAAEDREYVEHTTAAQRMLKMALIIAAMILASIVLYNVFGPIHHFSE